MKFEVYVIPNEREESVGINVKELCVLNWPGDLSTFRPFDILSFCPFVIT